MTVVRCPQCNEDREVLDAVVLVAYCQACSKQLVGKVEVTL